MSLRDFIKIYIFATKNASLIHIFEYINSINAFKIFNCLNSLLDL